MDEQRANAGRDSAETGSRGLSREPAPCGQDDDEVGATYKSDPAVLTMVPASLPPFPPVPTAKGSKSALVQSGLRPVSSGLVQHHAHNGGQNKEKGECREWRAVPRPFTASTSTCCPRVTFKHVGMN